MLERTELKKGKLEPVRVVGLNFGGVPSQLKFFPDGWAELEDPNNKIRNIIFHWDQNKAKTA